MEGKKVLQKKDMHQTRQVKKCVVWDLDNTLWHGILLEGDEVALHRGVVEIVQELDNRGILQSIASKNDEAQAMAKLQNFGLQEYFLYPQINWGTKSHAIETIARLLNISLDAIVFVDDQPFERDEVRHALPQVSCIDAMQMDQILHLPDLMPTVITNDARQRRLHYLSDKKRSEEESRFVGSKEEFLALLDMVMCISTAQEQDLQRAEELTVRTHQLNTTGYTYSLEELEHFSVSDSYKLLIARLEDKYGSYGIIGLAVVECLAEIWTIKLLLMSCRVMSRGVGTILLNHIMQLAKDNGVCLRAEFISNDRNRMMYVTYKFAGFKEVKQVDDLVILQNDLSHIQPFPSSIDVRILS